MSFLHLRVTLESYLERNMHVEEHVYSSAIVSQAISKNLMSRLRMSGSVTIFKGLPNGNQTAENLGWLVVF